MRFHPKSRASSDHAPVQRATAQLPHEGREEVRRGMIFESSSRYGHSARSSTPATVEAQVQPLPKVRSIQRLSVQTSGLAQQDDPRPAP